MSLSSRRAIHTSGGVGSQPNATMQASSSRNGRITTAATMSGVGLRNKGRGGLQADAHRKGPLSHLAKGFHPRHIKGGNDWKKAAMASLKRLYRSKFLLEDFIQTDDPMVNLDLADTLDSRDIPLSAVDAVGKHRKDLLNTTQKLELSKDVIKKLYARSLVLQKKVDNLVQEKVSKGFEDESEQTGSEARSEQELEEVRQAQKEIQEDIDADCLEVFEGDSQGDASMEVRLLRQQLQRSQEREARLQAQVESLQAVDIAAWDSALHKLQEGQHNAHSELLVQLQGMVKKCSESLYESQSELKSCALENSRLRAGMQSRDELLHSHIRAFLWERSECISNLYELVRLAPLGAGANEDHLKKSVTPRTGHNLPPDVREMLKEQMQALEELSRRMSGREAEEDSEDEEADEDVGFSNTGLSVRCDALARLLPAEGREELLHLVRELYHRFHLLNAEMDSLKVAYDSTAKDCRQRIQSVMAEHSLLRGALRFVWRKNDVDAPVGGAVGVASDVNAFRHATVLEAKNAADDALDFLEAHGYVGSEMPKAAVTNSASNAIANEAGQTTLVSNGEAAADEESESSSDGYESDDGQDARNQEQATGAVAENSAAQPATSTGFKPTFGNAHTTGTGSSSSSYKPFGPTAATAAGSKPNSGFQQPKPPQTKPKPAASTGTPGGFKPSFTARKPTTGASMYD